MIWFNWGAIARHAVIIKGPFTNKELLAMNVDRIYIKLLNSSY